MPSLIEVQTTVDNVESAQCVFRRIRALVPANSSSGRSVATLSQGWVSEVLELGRGERSLRWDSPFRSIR